MCRSWNKLALKVWKVQLNNVQMQLNNVIFCWGLYFSFPAHKQDSRSAPRVAVAALNIVFFFQERLDSSRDLHQLYEVKKKNPLLSDSALSAAISCHGGIKVMQPYLFKSCYRFKFTDLHVVYHLRLNVICPTTAYQCIRDLRSVWSALLFLFACWYCACLPWAVWRVAAECRQPLCSCRTLCGGHTACTGTWAGNSSDLWVTSGWPLSPFNNRQKVNSARLMRLDSLFYLKQCLTDRWKTQIGEIVF